MIKDVLRRRVHGYESLAGCSIAQCCKDWVSSALCGGVKAQVSPNTGKGI